MATCVFIQIRCKPGTTYRVAEQIQQLAAARHALLRYVNGEKEAARATIQDIRQVDMNTYAYNFPNLHGLLTGEVLDEVYHISDALLRDIDYLLAHNTTHKAQLEELRDWLAVEP